MGIVNVTPDSFADGGRYVNAKDAIAHARRLIEEGADIVDIGGESTRPGAAPVAEADEIARVLLRALPEIVADGLPVLGSLSRESTLGALTGRGVDDRVAASVAAALAAVSRGAAIVRVHDMRATVDAVAVWQAIERAS